MAQGIVYLVGAGPGDPGLMTVHGLECLRRAEVVIYDGLINPVLLSEASEEAERISLNAFRGENHHLDQNDIHRAMIERASQGKAVVRLKGGDPCVFSRCGEEALALAEAGIPFEIVPGVTSGFAAAAYAGIPLTHPEFSASLGLFSGHEGSGKGISNLNWQLLATGMDTLLFYMGMENLVQIAERLMENGRSPETPVAIVHQATTPRQKTLVSTLKRVGGEATQAGLKSPAIIVVGQTVSCREKMRWFDRRPLLGKRVVVTRTAEQTRAFATLLEAQGAEVLSCPVIETVPVPEGAEVDTELARLPQTDLLILTSTNAVDYFFSRLRRSGRDLRSLHGIEVIAVGPKTAAALEAHGLVPDWVPDSYRAEGVVELLLERGVSGKRVLYPRAELARDLIPGALEAAGAQVAAPVLYRTISPPGGGAALRQRLKEGVDILTFTSSSTVENFLTLAGPEVHDLLKGVVVVSIGPLTTGTAEESGLKVQVEAHPSTLEGMVTGMVEYFRSQESGAGSQKTF